MENPATPPTNVGSPAEVRQTLETHLPREQHSELWETLTKNHAVSDERPINLHALWGVLTTYVTGETLGQIWNALNRPVVGNDNPEAQPPIPAGEEKPAA